jgi:hypothetical protein
VLHTLNSENFEICFNSNHKSWTFSLKISLSIQVHNKWKISMRPISALDFFLVIEQYAFARHVSLFTATAAVSSNNI